MNPTRLILNPAAGRGRGKRLQDQIRSRFSYLRASDIAVTQFAGDERRIAEDALRSGCTTFVVVGGDGTCAGVADAVLKSGKQAAIAVIPSGTGNDFAKTLGVHDLGLDRIAALIEVGQTHQMDVGRADGKHFINSCGFGFDAAVLEATQQVRFLKGDAVYVYSALAQLLTYRGIEVAIRGRADADVRKMLLLTVSNGQFLGGAFHIAPDASAVDGELDFGFFTDGGVLERVRIFAGALRGRHLRRRSVRTERASRMTLDFPEAPMLEIDGELRRAQSSTVQIECLPRALNVIAAPGFPL